MCCLSVKNAVWVSLQTQTPFIFLTALLRLMMRNRVSLELELKEHGRERLHDLHTNQYQCSMLSRRLEVGKLHSYLSLVSEMQTFFPYLSGTCLLCIHCVWIPLALFVCFLCKNASGYILHIIQPLEYVCLSTNKFHFFSLIFRSWDFLQALSGFVALQWAKTRPDWFISLSNTNIFANTLLHASIFPSDHSLAISLLSWILFDIICCFWDNECWLWTLKYFSLSAILRYFASDREDVIS